MRSGPSHSRNSSREEAANNALYGYRRTRSLVSSSSFKPWAAGDALDDVPVRTSSLRHWSLTSSSTPPTTSSSSAAFHGPPGPLPASAASFSPPRPPSRHTANTSVDLASSSTSIHLSASGSSSTTSSSRHHTASTALSSLRSSSSRPPSRAASLCQASFCTAPESPAALTSPAASSVKAAASAFNIDDYVSSDDSFGSPHRPRGHGEEDLLFSPDGYGLRGLAAGSLPGLPDASAAPSPVVLPRPRRPRSSSFTLPSEKLRPAARAPEQPPQPSSASSSSARRASSRRRYIIDYADDDGLDPDLDDGSTTVDDRYYVTEADDFLARIPFALAPPPDHRRSSVRRLSALGLTYTAPASYNPHQHHHHHSLSAGYGSSGGGGPGSAAYAGYTSVGDDVIEEERFEKIDVAAAVRKRKEAKARKRALGLTRRRSANLKPRPTTTTTTTTTTINTTIAAAGPVRTRELLVPRGSHRRLVDDDTCDDADGEDY